MSIEITLLEAEDPGLVDDLTGLINRVYDTAEEGLWRDGATRTTRSDVARMVGEREIAVARLDGQLAGAVRVRVVSDVAGEFGMLAAAPEHRGRGVGRALIDFAEGLTRERGLQAMQLELLVPRTWRHPSKVFLDDWYRRIGYRVVRTTDVEALEPELAPMLATPCEFVVYEKPI